MDVWVSQWRETTLRPDVVKTIPKWFTFILMLFLNFWVFLFWEGNECILCAVGGKQNFWIKFGTMLNYVLYYSSFVFEEGILEEGLCIPPCWPQSWSCDLLEIMKYEPKLSVVLLCSIFPLPWIQLYPPMGGIPSPWIVKQIDRQPSCSQPVMNFLQKAEINLCCYKPMSFWSLCFSM